MAKFTCTFKDPDYNKPNFEGTSVAQAADRLKAKFVEWDEYITVEFDTDKGTARVVPLKEMDHA